jgi:hypothetical protein
MERIEEYGIGWIGHKETQKGTRSHKKRREGAGGIDRG